MNRVIGVSSDRKTVTYDGLTFAFSCIVRTNLTPEPGTRRLHDPGQVHYSSNVDGSVGKPVMPAQFPSGLWNVKDVVPTNGKDLGKIVVRTDAHQKLQVWALDENGGYDHPTDEWVEDHLYEFHFDNDAADGPFSVGCEHAVSQDVMDAFAALVKSNLDAGDAVQVAAV